jgi:O-antigen biosynthesis protein
VSERGAVDVSVAIATRDRPDMLARVLDALCASEPRPREIVVVDQSNNTRSQQVASERGGGNVPIRYVRNEHTGLGRAQNCAFSHAQCRIVAVTDDDCIPGPDWLAVIERQLAADAELAAMTGPVLPLPASEPGLVPVSSRTSRVARRFSGKHVPWEVGSGNNFAVRRAWLDAVRGNDERLGPGSPGKGGVDMDLFYRLLRAGGRIRYEPACVVYHTRVTSEDRLARRSPYGHGIGAGVAIWLREGDPYALWVLARWLALRMRRCCIGLFSRDWMLAREEVLVLRGTARGLLFGLRAGSRRRTSYAPLADDA